MGGVVWFVAEKHAMRLKGGWEGFGVLDTQTAPLWLESVVGAPKPKGRQPKKKRGMHRESFGRRALPLFSWMRLQAFQMKQ